MAYTSVGDGSGKLSLEFHVHLAGTAANDLSGHLLFIHLEGVVSPDSQRSHELPESCVFLLLPRRKFINPKETPSVMAPIQCSSAPRPSHHITQGGP